MTCRKYKLLFFSLAIASLFILAPDINAYGHVVGGCHDVVVVAERTTLGSIPAKQYRSQHPDD